MQNGLVGIGVVGYGYWGPNLVRNFAAVEGAQVIAICDMDATRMALGKRRHPGVVITNEFQDLLKDKRIDAIAIATPVHTHFELALAALKAGKHILVEKPLAQTSEQVRRLIEEAERRKLILMVDHTFLYTPAVQKIRELIVEGALGDIYYYNGIRASLGLFQSDVNVIWDLAVHDISIIQYILHEKPVAVSATGASHVAGSPENMAHITLFFQSSCIAHVSVNWLSPVKVRQTLIGGSRKMIVYDDVEATEKIKVYDRGITVSGTAENELTTQDRVSCWRYVGAASACQGSAADGSRALHCLPSQRQVPYLQRHDWPAGGRDSGGGVPFHCRARQSCPSNEGARQSCPSNE